MTKEQIKHMVDRFLGWRLPENFNPDGGISFKPFGNEGTPHQFRNHPSGTCLFDATQAEAMVRYMVEGMPASDAQLAEDVIAGAIAQPLGMSLRERHQVAEAVLAGLSAAGFRLNRDL